MKAESHTNSHRMALRDGDLLMASQALNILILRHINKSYKAANLITSINTAIDYMSR